MENEGTNIKFYKSYKFWIKIIITVGIIIWIAWKFVYSPYLVKLSSSEAKLYEALKETEDIQSLQDLNAETTVKIFLHAIKKEDWNIAPLFYVNDDGTLNNSFGPETPTPKMLKSYARKFRGIKGDFVHVGDGEGYIQLHGIETLSLERIDKVWHIDALNLQ